METRLLNNIKGVADASPAFLFKSDVTDFAKSMNHINT